MTEQTIKCPKCGFTIPVAKTLTSQIQAEVRKSVTAEMDADYQARLETQMANLEKQAEKKAQAAVNKQLSDLQTKVAYAEQKEKASKTVYQQRLTVEKARLDKQARLQAEQRFTARREELEASHRSREDELQKKLADAKKQAAELKRKLDQGSQQTQGDVAEEALATVLAKAFSGDKIEPVSKGKRGADLLQKVFNQQKEYCGTIIWESKAAQVWSKAWLAKLRTDQRRANAHLAIIVSRVLPEGVLHFAQIDGVWITEYSLAIGLATALRLNLIQATSLRRSLEGKHGKQEVEELYAYLSGVEFKHRVEAIVEAFKAMQDDLEGEKRTVQKHWAQRQKQLQLVIQNVVGMYGELQGIMGPKLPRLRTLELQSGSSPK